MCSLINSEDKKWREGVSFTEFLHLLLKVVKHSSLLIAAYFSTLMHSFKLVSVSNDLHAYYVSQARARPSYKKIVQHS